MTAPPRIRIPRWVQLVVLPVLLVVAFLLARTLGHVIFLFLTAAVIYLAFTTALVGLFHAAERRWLMPWQAKVSR